MPRRNRVNPWGDLQAVPDRGLFTGNRGCLVDGAGTPVRHHRGRLWITCVTRFRGRRVGLARPGRWTPLFFLDDAVALAAGHRPCGECRHADHLAYRDAVARSAGTAVRAADLDARLAVERLVGGRRGVLDRAGDRILWTAPAAALPDGTVVVPAAPLDDRAPADPATPRLLLGAAALAFGFGGWTDPVERPVGPVRVLTPPTSVAALRHGFVPTLHASAG